MNLLLDTHAFLWFITNDPRLSSQAQSLIQAPANRRWLSMASLWEMAIKVSLGKLTLAQPFDQVHSPAASIEPDRGARHRVAARGGGRGDALSSSGSF
jgi:PIN domain nuclease of toxin-antitoxin system